MASRFHSTVFGQLVRAVSGNKVFRYPDEIDPSLWRKAVPSPSSEGENSDSVTKDAGAQDLTATNPIVDDWEDILLNPHNWSAVWKAAISVQMCILNFGVYIASSIYVPGEQNVMLDFGVSETVATLGLSFFTVGYGLGPMLWSPMSEMPQLGRTAIFFWTLFAFILLQMPTGFAVNMPMFLVFRVLTGFCGSPCLATGGGTIVDMFDPANVSYMICIWSSAGVLGPVFGPLIGGFLAPVKGWRWTIWLFTWLCSCVLITMFFFLPETSAANILYKRAKRLRKATGDSRLKSQSEIDAAHHTLRNDLIVLARAFTLTLSEPIVFLMDLYAGLLYGVLFIWFESFPLVFGDIYGFTVQQQGLAYLGILVGTVITLSGFLLWVRYGIVAKFNKPGFKPEMVLPPTFIGSLALPICLFWYGWSAQKSIHWIMPIIGSGIFTIGVVTLFNSLFNYLGISYPVYAASIFAGSALFRACFAASFPLFAPALFHHLGIGPGNSLLGGIAICFIPIPFVFYKYGGKIRHMSKNARHDL